MLMSQVCKVLSVRIATFEDGVITRQIGALKVLTQKWKPTANGSEHDEQLTKTAQFGFDSGAI